MRAENDHALKIQGMDDRRKIQVLLAMTEPVVKRVAELGSIRLYNLAVATARRNTGSLSTSCLVCYSRLLRPLIGPGPVSP